MRNVILISLAVFIAVVTGGYCIAWFAQAAQIRHGIEHIVEKINTPQKYITYDAIETTGFPSEIYVSIVRPHFTGRIDVLLKTLIKDAPDTPQNASQKAKIEAMPEWNTDVQLNGRLTFGINALSNHYSMAVSGGSTQTSKIGEQAINSVSQPAGDTVCNLQLSQNGGVFDSLWNYQSLLRGKEFLKDFRMLDCTSPGNVTSDAVSHDKLTTTGPMRFYVTSAPQGGQQQVRFYLKGDMEVTPQGDAMMNSYRSAFSPGLTYPVKYSLFGKQNLEIDLSYAGPADWQPGDKNPPLDIKLSKLDISNQMYTTNTTFFLSNGMNGANRVARLAFKSLDNFSEPYDAFLQDMVHGYIQQLYARPEQFPPVQPYLQKYTQDQFYAIIYPVIPNFHSLTPMVQSLDISYQGAADLSTGDVTLSDLEISTSPYGIKGSGSAKRAAGQPLPSGQAVLTCSNCERLVDDVIAYATRLQKTMSYFQTPEQLAATTPIDPRLADGVKAFLKALAGPAKDSDPNKTAFVYTIVSDGTMGIAISGKRLNDVLAMYNEYVGSILKAPPAANGAAAPAAETPAPAAAPAQAPAVAPPVPAPAR